VAGIASFQREQPVIEFECLGCGTTFEVSDSLAGKVIKCRECHQPGKVHAPFDSSPRIKITERSEKTDKPEKTSSSPLAASLKASYACPCCGTRVLWEWRRCWTPASSLLLLVGLFINLNVCWWSYQWAARKGLFTSVAELDATISGGRLFWVFVFLCIAVTLDVMAFRLLWDWRQACPRCGVRIG
jgi:DNA-directed RNA polymerase subunit RPC12/RpoP